MAAHIDHVPPWVRITTGILALLFIAYGIMCYLDLSLLFNQATGVDFTNPFIKNAGYEFAARNLAIGLAMAFVTIIKGAPEALTILSLVRALIEIQIIVISLIR